MTLLFVISKAIISEKGHITVCADAVSVVSCMAQFMNSKDLHLNSFITAITTFCDTPLWFFRPWFDKSGTLLRANFDSLGGRAVVHAQRMTRRKRYFA